MKTRITTDGYTVTLAYDDALEQRVTREFSCPEKGGYITEHVKGGRTTQPCAGLARTGATLMTNSRAALIDTIRREYRTMRAAA